MTLPVVDVSRSVEESHMSRALGPILMLCLGCAALQPGSAPPTIPITVHSHNRSDVDVYLLCGDRDAEWLGVVREKEVLQLEIPRARARCVLGLNFFLVSRTQNRGYWVGPLHPVAGTSIALTIEKYAGLSSADLHW
jgi:hypothetical protein